MLQINQNVRTHGFGMGEQSEVVAHVGLRQMVIASGISAGMMALAQMGVDTVRDHVHKNDATDKVMLVSDEGLEVSLSLADVDTHIERVQALQKVAIEALEKEAVKKKEAEEATETKETKGKTEEEKKA